MTFLSKITVANNPAAVKGALTGAGMKGPLSTSLAVVVSTGVSQAFTSSAQYVGSAPNVAVGSDISKVSTSNGSSLVKVLNGTLRGAMSPSGPALGMMARGLGNGIANLLAAGTGTAAVTGIAPVPPVPGSGPTSSVVV